MRYVIIVFLGILAIFLIVLMETPIGIEPLTEVYFEAHEKLPKHIFLKKPYEFSFTINNLEHQDVEYSYVVEAYNVNGELIKEINRGTVTLSHEEKETISQELMIEEKFEKARISVKVTKEYIGEPEFKRKLWWEGNQVKKINIHFWVEEIVGTTITITED